MKVKICANKTIAHAQMCLDAGVDIVGLLIGQSHSSVDFISIEQGKEICDFINHRCNVAVVTHLENADEIIRICKLVGNDFLQLHSNIDEKEVKKIKNELNYLKLIRVIHISQNGKILTNYSKIKYVDYYLLDSINNNTNQVGGTGLTHDWTVSAELITKLNKPTFLAGGLTPINVRDAIKICKPYGVDVNSGCKLNGEKNASKVLEFTKKAKNN